MLERDREGLDIATSKDHRCLLEQGFASAVVKIESPSRNMVQPGFSTAFVPYSLNGFSARPLLALSSAAASRSVRPRGAQPHVHDPLRPGPHHVHHRAIVVDILQNRLCA